MSKDFGPRPLPCFLPVERFVVDGAYQRKIASPRSQKLIAKIVDNFCWAHFGAVHASTREGGNYALRDGHHRIEAVKRIGPDHIQNVPAVLMDLMTLEDEAQSFVRVNRDRVPVDVFTMHRANVLSGDVRACQIEKLACETGLIIPAHQPNRNTIKAGEVVCLNVLGTLLDRYDWQIAVGALQSVAEAYRDEIYGIRAAFLMVSAKLLKDGDVDQASLVAAFLQSTAEALYAQSGPDGTRNIAPSRLDRIMEILRERMAKSRHQWLSEHLPHDIAGIPVTGRQPQPGVGIGGDLPVNLVTEAVKVADPTPREVLLAQPQHARKSIPIIDRPQLHNDDWSITPPTRDQLRGRR